ncbi:hypothetical protein ABZW11_26345 [Nonomuraea sp. NPDC004580]|uniref:hypothetical protein n=1 Tax=Nonomuraea sp. NPDC004580 TaxID=3154552 RepID=UPI0033A13B63
MAATITAATVGKVLRTAADRVAALPHAKVVRTDVHHALAAAAPSYALAQAALDQLAAHVPDAAWLNTWSKPHPRDEVAAEMRAAADRADVRPFDWTVRPTIVPVQVPRGESR